ncbi:unnamed protein product [Notodromas monacha]|uniref:Uncharacterized protein n=1 Tax=Notodromas monacha TaxID=399045 RepID=A0A7R9BZH3_9CRUS|nr:unnamed protein product [Notodromas monacha]CAG0924545.1 unnamed protein product [Notodromas monacha]
MLYLIVFLGGVVFTSKFLDVNSAPRYKDNRSSLLMSHEIEDEGDGNCKIHRNTGVLFEHFPALASADESLISTEVIAVCEYPVDETMWCPDRGSEGVTAIHVIFPPRKIVIAKPRQLELWCWTQRFPNASTIRVDDRIECLNVMSVTDVLRIEKGCQSVGGDLSDADIDDGNGRLSSNDDDRRLSENPSSYGWEDDEAMMHPVVRLNNGVSQGVGGSALTGDPGAKIHMIVVDANESSLLARGKASAVGDVGNNEANAASFTHRRFWDNFSRIMIPAAMFVRRWIL